MIKRKTRRLMTGTLGATLAVVMLSGCGQAAIGGEASAAKTETLKIGVLIPTSGVYAEIGSDTAKGFETYLELNDSKIAGRDVEVVVADTAGDPAIGKTAAQRLIQQDEVDAVVGVVSSAVGLAIAPDMDAKKTPLIITVASGVPVGDSPYVWRSNLPATGSDVGAAPVVGKYLAETVGDGVYTMASDYAGGRTQIEGFLNGYTSAGAKTSGEVFTPFQTTTDYQPYLAEIKAANPSAVYAFYAGGEAVNFVKQYEAFGLKGQIPLFGLSTLASPEVLEAQGDSAVGINQFGEWSANIEGDVNKEFVAAYVDLHDSEPSWYSATAYLAGQMLEEALAQDAEGEDLRTKIMEGLKLLEEIDSPMGTTKFEGSNQSPTHDVLRVEITRENGVFGNKIIENLGPAT
ncbi:MAG: ABC-type branched-chain amino acid transport system, extracellular component [Cryobacterium sp.]|jgi:branched-chain amino acid transport system substrate-binding protein|nr:ABC-type branched-chain amino acid transport system, extracellular component [Cryobacterium sp.]